MTGAAPEAATPTVLGRLQRGIEALYRVDTRLDVESFLIDDKSRRQAGVSRTPREQVLIRQGSDDDEVHIGLFLDRGVVANLERNDPNLRLDEDNFSDFCLAVEGISHFVYLAMCAAGDRPVSALELELQAEVDKFACCVLVMGGDPNDEVAGLRGGAGAQELTWRLYQRVSFASDLDGDERDRYRVANQEARRYAETLSRSFVARDRMGDMLRELRSFYRMGLDGKLSHIARLAA